MRFTLVFLALSFALFTLTAQNQLSSVLVDSDTYSPIAYASIMAKGSQRSTISNEDGYFTLQVSETTDSITIYHLALGRRSFGIEAFSVDTFPLPFQDLTLDVVAILSDSPEKVWKKVIDRLGRNHVTELSSYHTTSRVIRSGLGRSKVYSIAEVSAVMHFTGKDLLPKVEGVQMRSRHLSKLGEEIDKKLDMGSIVPFINLFRIFDDVLNKKVFRKFDITIEGTRQLGENLVAEVRLAPRKKKSKGLYEFYIDLESYAILRAHKYDQLDPSHYSYEVGFARTGDKWYYNYHDYSWKVDRFTEYPFIQHTLTAIQPIHQSPSEDAKSYMAFSISTDRADVQIPWNDPYWQSLPLVPWPDWVVEQLEAEGIAR